MTLQEEYLKIAELLDPLLEDRGVVCFLAEGLELGSENFHRRCTAEEIGEALNEWLWRAHHNQAPGEVYDLLGRLHLFVRAPLSLENVSAYVKSQT